MTRFARAKGSKSSNEKVPEESTPWSELKKGMQLKQEHPTQETIQRVSALKSNKEVKPSEWACLDDDNTDSLSILKNHLKRRQEGGNVEENATQSNVKIKSKILKKKTVDDSGVKQKKKKKGALSDSEIKETHVNVKEEMNEKDEQVESEKKVKKKKKSKIVELSLEKEEKNKEIRTKGVKQLKNFIAGNLKQKMESAGFGENEKKKKFKENKSKMDINIGGELVSLVKFQGFFIREDDAARLKELKKKMVKEGIAQSQIESVLKLERRRCEKALARMKKNVCFHCRKPGHVLSQCPDRTESVDTATGVCYKCGSTEHTAFSCKVTQGKNFPFAECFICKEKGHIARECPDNPRGLYPRGGCCKLCGDVTHLKKDCPKKVAEAEENVIKLGVRDERNLEGLEVCTPAATPQYMQKKRKKLVKF